MDPYSAAQPVSTGSNTVAIIALILAIIAIVIIVVIAVVIYRDTSQITNVLKTWTVVTASATSPASFTATPNTIFQIPSSIPSSSTGYTVNIVAYADIATVVTSGTTSIFIIDNTAGNNDVTVTFTGGSIQAWTSGTSTKIDKGKSGEFVWLSSVSVSRLW